jgi:pyruvate-ferredoxin/flavodoxin oxidoreductase
MAHRTSYVMSGTIAHVNHLIESYIDGLNSRRPALFNIYAVCPPEHGVGDDKSVDQSKLAVEGRAYPLFRFDPDAGTTFAECVSLEGNPSLDTDWPTYTLKYVDEAGASQSMELRMTFADFAATEARFLKHFRKAPPETWNESMVPVADFLELDLDEREGKFPFIWAVDRKKRLIRVVPAAPIVRACEDRRSFWRTLKSLAGIREQVDPQQIEQRVRLEVAQTLAARLLDLAGAAGDGPAIPIETWTSAPAVASAASPAAGGDGFVAPWIDSASCTSCDECIAINPKIFAYDDKKKAFVKDPRGGPFKDIVRAAEKCTGMCIHPGSPADSGEKDLDKLVKRAAKFQ